MKWIALFAAIAIAPWVGQRAREDRVFDRYLWTLFGALPFLLGALPLDMSLIDWAGWPGHTKGLQVSLLDIIAVALVFTRPSINKTLPFKTAMGLYFAAALLSIFQAEIKMPTVFYCWQLARVFLVYAVVARASADTGVVEALLTGLTIGLCFQAGLAIWQRFGLGMLQAAGTFGHQNSLGLTIHFVLFPMFALLLLPGTGFRPVIATIAGLIISILTTSRATVGFVVFGLVLLFALLSVRSWTPKKTRVLFVGLLVIFALLPLGLSSFEARFAREASTDNYDERAAFEKAASMLVADHPMGVGANSYVVVANTQGYLDRAGVAAIGPSRSTLVHNAYWAVAGETGYLGLLAFLLLFLCVTYAALSNGWSYDGPRADLLLGLGMSLLIVMMHNLYEWIIFYAPMQYLFAIVAGLIAGVSAQLRKTTFGRQAPP